MKNYIKAHCAVGDAVGLVGTTVDFGCGKHVEKLLGYTLPVFPPFNRTVHIPKKLSFVANAHPYHDDILTREDLIIRVTLSMRERHSLPLLMPSLIEMGLFSRTSSIGQTISAVQAVQITLARLLPKPCGSDRLTLLFFSTQ